MHVRAHAGVEAHGADVHAVAAVAFYDVYGADLAVYELREVEEAVLVLAEHLDEVVAGAAGEVGDGGVGEARRAVHALVERAVAAAGVDAQLRAVGRGLADVAAGVHGRLGDVYVKAVAFALLGGEAVYGLVYEPQLVLRLLLARDGVDYKEMLHLRLPPFLYM